MPKDKREAIEQGEQLAMQERRRLGLGLAPLPDLSELLEGQGVRSAQVSLPEDISGLTLIDSKAGYFVAVNREHPFVRRRFSFAHEYCHLLVDRDRKGIVSRGQDRAELLEVRANAFAGAFLMPREAVLQVVRGLGKGRQPRTDADVFDEVAPVQVRARSATGSQTIQLYDVVQVAHRFRVSRASAAFRLKDLRLLTRIELDALRDLDAKGHGRELAGLLGLPEPDDETLRNQFRKRFIALALEAFRRDEISFGKLTELARMVNVERQEIEGAIASIGLSKTDGAPVQMPEA